MSDLNVYQRMLGVMEDVSYIQKGEKTVNGQYRFASHDEVTAKLHPALVKHRLLALPSVQELTQDGNRTEVKLSVTFLNVDKPEEAITCIFHGFGIDPADKGPGKAISYAFKYAMLKTFCLETGDDADNNVEVQHEPREDDFRTLVLAQLDAGDTFLIEKFLNFGVAKWGLSRAQIKKEASLRPHSFLSKFEDWKNKRGEEISVLLE